MLEPAALKVEKKEEKAERIKVRGLVQGVGFRPTVWRLAQAFNLRGSVANNGDGVEIYVCGLPINLEDFVAALQTQTPPLSRIDEIKRTPAELLLTDVGFRIAESETTKVQTGVVPDAATCEACVAETLNPAARRFRYPFTNCTHCGPRLSIIETIPYDRANTTMRDFEMCELCRAEYENPADRRFHAQPIACPKCGPQVWLQRADNQPIAFEIRAPLDEINAAVNLIENGFIVAIKGIGGFQLACDATNETAVARLRELKHRERKPFALMVRDLKMAREFCRISETEEKLLQTSAAPIVILPRRKSSEFRVRSAKSDGVFDSGLKTQDSGLRTQD